MLCWANIKNEINATMVLTVYIKHLTETRKTEKSSYNNHTKEVYKNIKNIQ